MVMILSSGVGSTNDNEVTINNANVKTYIVGGYNQDTEESNRTEPFLKQMLLKIK